MFLEALGSALLGFALACAAAYRLPHRLPSRTLVLPTGTAGALFGAFLAHTALGSANYPLILTGALVMAAASCPCSCARRSDFDAAARRRPEEPRTGRMDRTGAQPHPGARETARPATKHPHPPDDGSPHGD